MRVIILSILCIYTTFCEEKVQIKRNPLPYFRRKVEEMSDDAPIEKAMDDSHNNLLSLLVKNVKELFNEFDNDVKGDAEYHKESTLNYGEDDREEPTLTTEVDSGEVSPVTIETETTVKLLHANPKFDDKGGVKVLTTIKGPFFRNNDLTNVENTNDIMLYDNISLNETPYPLNKPTGTLYTTTKSTETGTRTAKYVKTKTRHKKVMNRDKELDSLEKSEHSFNVTIIPNITPPTSISSYVLESTAFIRHSELNKTCIYCDNVINDNCRDPKNKIVPFTVCKRANDLCYSLHTPFGLVDRGCFNINHRITTYVCSCNLCNYISISEMPYFFSHKKHWIDNVFELSRTRNFRQSIFKDMTCLRCEVNTTVKTTALVDSVNCLEGNIEHLPVEECNANEICGVKAKRADGYIWRGCIKRPLYNYWISLCDRDLCNSDKLMTIYQP